jgi:hypothetical protein
MPTKRDAAGFGCTEWIEEAFCAMGVTPEDVREYSEGPVSEVVSGAASHEQLPWICLSGREVLCHHEWS